VKKKKKKGRFRLGSREERGKREKGCPNMCHCKKKDSAKPKGRGKTAEWAFRKKKEKGKRF